MKGQVIFLISFALFAIVASNEGVPSTSAKACEPNTEFTKDCSVCKCNGDGTELSCEKKDCPATENTPKVTESTQVETCTPGELYKVKCNECKCPESGKKSEAACTIIGCPDE